MDFNLTDEQKMLKDTARRFIAEQCPKEYVREMEADEYGYSKEIWQKIAELGWLGLILPEKYGGTELGLLSLALIMEEIGFGCFPGPFLETALGALMILDSENEKIKDELLPKIASGETLVTLAYQEPGNTVYEPSFVATTANKEGDDFIINGTKLFVQNANSADYFVVTARTGCEELSEKGITLFLIPANNKGIKITPLITIAGDKQFEAVFDNVKIEKDAALVNIDRGWEILNKNLKIGAVAKSAQMVGGASSVIDIAVEYAKIREQFGNPIGRFQAVQHHCANMLIDLNGGRYITYKAAWMIDEKIPCDLIIASAKAWTSDACNRIAALAHQVGGGAAYIVEDDTTLYSRRIKAGELAYGDAAYYRKQAAKSLKL